MQRLSISGLLNHLRRTSDRPALIDVRAETEHAKAAVPGFHSAPILWQNERHEVGITYKEQGQAAAIARGAELVLPSKDERVAQWGKLIDASPLGEGVVACWRGGMRSEIACQWLTATGRKVWQVEGGYKALRHELLARLEQPPPLVVITGLTGSGKTELLQTLGSGAVDLEAAAKHRGSAFGSWLGTPQPAQATFENAVALQLLRLEQTFATAFIEDESRMIGGVAIPELFFGRMQRAPLVILTETLDSRCRRLYEQYIAAPLAEGYTLEQLAAKALQALSAVSRRLATDGPIVRAQVERAFAEPPTFAAHEEWLATLLVNYYDRGYRRAANRHSDHPVLFQGDLVACQQWSTAYLSARRAQ